MINNTTKKLVLISVLLGVLFISGCNKQTNEPITPISQAVPEIKTQNESISEEIINKEVIQESQQITGRICSLNAYNCGDFSTHAEAQAVYEECGGVSNDIHQLDKDKDGSACETLP